MTIEEIEKILNKENKLDRPLRLLELLKLKECKNLTDEHVWLLIEDIWVESEHNHKQKEIWTELFSLRKVPEYYTNDLPDEVRIFRGGNKNGISWSLSGETAQWFAERYGHNQKLWVMKIKKSDILFTSKLRDEDEVIIIPRDYHEQMSCSYYPDNKRKTSQYS